MSATFLKDLTNKVVIVTGSSSGIGEAVAVLFAQLGSKVVITGRNEERVLKVAQKCEFVSPSRYKPLTVIGDLSQEESVRQLVNKTLENHDSIDTVVTAAGYNEPNWLTSLMDEGLMHKYEEVMNLDVKSVLLLCHLCMPHLIKTKGRIVAISSVNSIKASEGMILHSMSKAAIDMLIKTLALKFGEKGVRVNSVNPGVVNRPIWNEMGIPKDAIAAENEKAAKFHALNRIAEPEEIARAVAFLASDASSFVTGTNMVVDGGSLVK